MCCILSLYKNRIAGSQGTHLGLCKIVFVARCCYIRCIIHQSCPMKSQHFTSGVSKLFCQRQGRSEVRWRPGQEASLGLPYSKPRSFESKCTALKKALVALLGLFGASRSHSAPPAVIWRPHSDSAPGELRPLAPSLRSWSEVR